MLGAGRSFASARQGLARRRLFAGALVAALLASLCAIVPATTPRALAADSSGSNAIWFVALAGTATGGTDCSSPDFVVADYVDGAEAAIEAAIGAASSGDTIRLCTGSFDLTTGQVDVTVDALTFEGESTAGTIVDGGSTHRLFDATGNTVAFAGLTLTNGKADDTTGGAVRAAAVTITGSVVTANEATVTTPGIDAGLGGAIHATGDVSITDSQFTSNTSGDIGGAVYAGGNLSITGGSFVDNSSATLAGGVFASGTVTIDGATFIGNRALSDGGAVGAEGLVVVADATFGTNVANNGGAIGGISDVRVLDSDFSANTATSNGGAISGAGSVEVTGGTFRDNTAGLDGGAIYSKKFSVTAIDSAFERNRADGNGGAVFAGGLVELSGGSFSGNSTSSGDGGAVSAGGNVSITDGTFTENTAGTGTCTVSGCTGGAVFAKGDITAATSTFLRNVADGNWGGAIDAYCEDYSDVTLLDSDFTGNRAAFGLTDGTGFEGGGAVCGTNVSVADGTFAMNASGGKGGAVYSYGATVIIDGAIFTDNSAVNVGGAVDGGFVTVTDSEFTANSSAAQGGAVHADNSIAILDSSFDENTAGTGGAAQSNGSLTVTGSLFTDNSSGGGGALASIGAVDVSSSTFARNRAVGDSATGGALQAISPATSVTIRGSTFEANASGYDGSAVYSETVTRVTNSTFVGNAASGPNAGDGAIYVLLAPADVRNVTFLDNAGDDGLGALEIDGDLSVANTIFGSASDACIVYGDLIDLGGNIAVTDGSSGCVDPLQSLSTTTGDPADLDLGALTDNGGPTETVAIGATSIALDYGLGTVDGDPASALVCTESGDAWSVASVDQRGEARPSGPDCDAGAYEYPAGAPEVAYIVDEAGGTNTCADYPSIQDAADAASDGDVIHICAGTYTLTTPVVVAGKDLVFEATTGTTTILDGGGTSQLFTSDSDLGFVSLTLRNAFTTGDGGAVFAIGSVSVTDATFVDNSSGARGGAILSATTVSVSDGTFLRNYAEAEGGAIHASVVDGGPGTYEDNTSGTASGGAIHADTVTSAGDEFRDNVAPAGDGGALHVTFLLDLSGGTFTGNTAGSSEGGAIQVDELASAASIRDSYFEANSASGQGGAVAFPTGLLEIDESEFHENTAGSGGAVAAGDVISVASVYADNTADTDGGAILAITDVTLTDGSFERNVAENGGIGGGGAIAAGGAVTAVGTSFEGNLAVYQGGAIRATGEVSLRLTTFLANAGTFSAGAIWSDADVSATDATFTGNRGGYGGAIYSNEIVRLTRGSFTDNTADTNFGGAIVGYQGLEVVGTAFTGNSSVGEGGATWSDGPVDLSSATFTANSAVDDGGAVYVANLNPATVVRSTFSGNTSEAEGGAIYLGGGLSGGPISIEASTFDANSADAGGAVYGGTTVASVRNSTFYENTAGTGDGGAFAVDTVDVTNGTFVRNSAVGNGDHIVAVDLSADDTIFAAGDCDVTNTPTESGSLDEDGFCAGDLPPLGLNLGAFGDWGGPTKTVKLVSPSDAIDSTPAVSGACLSATDQRGVARPQSGACDAGAYEVSGTVLTYTGPSVVYTSGSVANVNLSGTTYPALAGCDLRFSVSDGSSPAFTLDATTGLKGTGTVTAYNLSAAVATYEVIVSALGDCAGIPDASGAFVVVSTAYGGKGTAGGGSYKVDTFSGRVKFAHVVQVRTVTSKVGKTSVITTTTKGSLLWTYKNVWRLKANLNYSSTDGSATYALVTCTAAAFSGGVAPTGFTGKCGQFSGAALLQVYDADAGEWIASTYTKVTFVATVYDGGTKSVCSKNRCTTTEYPDWFGVAIKANNVPLGPSTSPDGVPTSLLRSLASPDGNGSLKAN